MSTSTGNEQTLNPFTPSPSSSSVACDADLAFAKGRGGMPRPSFDASPVVSRIPESAYRVDVPPPPAPKPLWVGSESVVPIRGAVYLTDEHGWRSPFPMGHPLCPLSGQDSDAGRGRATVMFWVLLAAVCGIATGAGLGLWLVLSLLGQFA